MEIGEHMLHRIIRLAAADQDSPEPHRRALKYTSRLSPQLPNMAPSQPPPSNVTERRVPVKLKRKREPARSDRASTSTPNAYSRRSPPRELKRPRSPSPIREDEDDGDRSPPRKLKRPGTGARIDRQAVEAVRAKREQEERAAAAARARSSTTTGVERVAEYYNAVPERGRAWRQTDSRIKGLRSMNNWVKSTLIQKFAPNGGAGTEATERLCVLDMACGKGGDLGKWEKAPVVPALYVGCDIAGVSVEQARRRWAETGRGGRGRAPRMRAEFFVQDAFGDSVGRIPLVQQVGFNPHAGPTGGVIQGGMATGGFDVVSMMFALHYSFESEELARGMLKNVAGALKKGGRFIGVMPASDVISATVKRLLRSEAGHDKTLNGKASAREEMAGSEDGEVEEEWNPENPTGSNGAVADSETNDDEWDPEKPSDPSAVNTTNGDADGDDWDPEKPSEPILTTTGSTTPAASTTPDQPPLEWGNSLYSVRFPRTHAPTARPLPADGVFRPPYGWRYHYRLAEAVDVPEYVVPWEAFRALAEEYGLELLYRKGFREVLDEVRDGRDGAVRADRELGMLAERMGVLSRDRSAGRGGLLVGDEELEAAGFYHAFCFYRS